MTVKDVAVANCVPAKVVRKIQLPIHTLSTYEVCYIVLVG